MIRAATLDDMPRLLELGQKFFDESGMADFTTYDPASAAELFAAMLQLPTGAIFLMERAGQVVGGIGGLIAPHYFNRASLSCTELFWFVEKKARGSLEAVRLVCTLRDWAARQGATVLTMAALESSPPSIKRLYAKMGLRPQENYHMGRIDQWPSPHPQS